MGDVAKTFIGGVVAIGMVAAFGIHASGLTQLTRAGGSAGSGLLNTAVKG